MEIKQVFERWAVQHGYNLAEVGAPEDRTYKEPLTRAAWESWKAAQKYYACLYDFGETE